MHYYANGNEFSDTCNTVPEKLKNSIICGDSESVLKRLPDNCIDLVLTSPPYNFNRNYGKYDDDKDWETYFDKLLKIFDECIRVTKYGGRIIVNVQPLYSSYIPTHHIISNHMIKRKLIWRNEILWEKNNYTAKPTSWGSWKSPSSPYLKYTWEFIEVFSKGSLKHGGDSDNIDIDGESFKKWTFGKWSIAPERNMKKYGHPAMFPEELCRRAMLLFSYKNDTILDPFNGAGTVSAVAVKTGRNYIGIDIDQKYCDSAERRIAGMLESF